MELDEWELACVQLKKKIMRQALTGDRIVLTKKEGMLVLWIMDMLGNVFEILAEEDADGKDRDDGAGADGAPA